MKKKYNPFLHCSRYLEEQKLKERQAKKNNKH